MLSLLLSAQQQQQQQQDEKSTASMGSKVVDKAHPKSSKAKRSNKEQVSTDVSTTEAPSTAIETVTLTPAGNEDIARP